MAKSPHNVCAFCGQKGGKELGSLRNTSDRTILAHYNCLIFSPLVFTTDAEDNPEFVIPSVLAEIKRGRSLKCSYCKQSGATIGCEVKRCHKTYHYECVEKDQGIRDNGRYIVYCSKHVQELKKDSDSPQNTKRSRTPDRSSTSQEDEMPIFSRQLFTSDSEDESEFNIASVIAEIKRGKELKCSYCKKAGATISCSKETCKKTYHLLCVEKDEGILDDGDDRNVAYCFKHAKNAEKDSSTQQETERSRLGSSPSTSYALQKKTTRTSTPGTFSSPRAKKKKNYAEQDSESSASSERPSTSNGTITLGKRTRKSTPGTYSSPRAKKMNYAESESSGSSERPSTSNGTRSLGKRTRNSTPGNYSSTPAKKKNYAKQDSESSASSESPSTSYGTRPSQTRNRNSGPGVNSSRHANKSSPAQEAEWSRSSSSSSASEETPVRKRKRNSKPRQIFNQNKKRTKRTAKKLEDQQTPKNDASNEADLITTMSESPPVKPKARRGRPPSKKKRQEAASTLNKNITIASVHSEDIQQCIGDAETEEMDAQAIDVNREEMDAQAIDVEREETDAQAIDVEREEMDSQAIDVEREEMDAQAIDAEREEMDAQAIDAEREETDAQSSGEEREETDEQARGEERREMDAQAGGEEREKMDAGARVEERKGMDAQASKPNEERATPLSQHTLNDFCIPSTSQARLDINELYFSKLHESQCRIANSIESGVSEFRNFVQQFQTLFTQFLDICQSLNHGISSNLTNAHEQNTSLEVNHRLDATPDPLPLSQANSHFPALTHDSANDADTNIDTPSSEILPPNDSKSPSRILRSSLSAKKKRR